MPTKSLIQKLKKLRAEGKTNAEIAKILGIRESTVICIIGS